MARNKASAKKAGAAFERTIADYLSGQVDERIDRRVRNGSKDRGDIAGVRHMGGRVVIEVKNVSRWSPGEWLNEAEIERGNDDALAGMVIAKRHGNGNPADQIVMLTVADLVALLIGERPEVDQ